MTEDEKNDNNNTPQKNYNCKKHKILNILLFILFKLILVALITLLYLLFFFTKNNGKEYLLYNLVMLIPIVIGIIGSFITIIFSIKTYIKCCKLSFLYSRFDSISIPNATECDTSKSKTDKNSKSSETKVNTNGKILVTIIQSIREL